MHYNSKPKNKKIKQTNKKEHYYRRKEHVMSLVPHKFQLCQPGTPLTTYIFYVNKLMVDAKFTSN